MAYSKAKLKSSGDRASPCFRPFWIRKLSDKCLHTLTLLYISRPSLWSSGQSSWLRIQRSGFDSRHYQVFWEVVGQERDPLSLMSTNEELFGRKNSGYGLENRNYDCRVPQSWPRNIPSNRKKLALTSPTTGGRSIGIVRSPTKATELFISYVIHLNKF
jgi:hypothetical protein